MPRTSDYLPRVPVYTEGDVLHRMQVRIEEVRESFAIMAAAAAELPEGRMARAAAADPAGPLRAGGGGGLARRDSALGAHGAGQSPGAVQGQRPVGE